MNQEFTHNFLEFPEEVLDKQYRVAALSAASRIVESGPYSDIRTLEIAKKFEAWIKEGKQW